MPEELSIEWCSEDATMSRRLEVLGKNRPDEANKMFRVLLKSSFHFLALVLHFVCEVSLRTGDSPVPMAAGEMFLVKIEIPAVARITVLPAPYLQCGPWVSGENAHRLLLWLA